MKKIIEAIEEKLNAQENEILMYKFQIDQLKNKLAEAEKTIEELKGEKK